MLLNRLFLENYRPTIFRDASFPFGCRFSLLRLEGIFDLHPLAFIVLVVSDDAGIISNLELLIAWSCLWDYLCYSYEYSLKYSEKLYLNYLISVVFDAFGGC